MANTVDNMAPLVSAINNPQGFPRSVNLVQNSYGVRQHTSVTTSSTNSFLARGLRVSPIVSHSRGLVRKTKMKIN
ncbi:hypothetical protein HD806DRAFT_515330 [Xylariaceae sp. AK1471]|nr:hypothetical protein HD806DRAFT_515330 [Xylariaceae sp. AK1471]